MPFSAEYHSDAHDRRVGVSVQHERCQSEAGGPVASEPKVRLGRGLAGLRRGQPTHQRIKHRPATRAGFQVLVHDDPKAEVDADCIRENAHEVRVAAGHRHLADADPEPSADCCELRQVAVGAQGKG